MKMMDLSTKIGEFKWKNPIANASGPRCTSAEELDILRTSVLGAFVSKSSTAQPREGNPAPRYIDLPMGSINSMGIPNFGIDFYLDYYKKHHSVIDKPFFLSIAGLTLEENISMLKKIRQADFSSLVELNLSCPNVPGKPQIAYDFEQTYQVLEHVFDCYPNALGVKLPPYFDFIHFEQMADILNRFPLKFVTCINSIGNGLFVNVENESVVIKPKEGFGGMGGDYVKPTALANVRQFYNLLREDIQIIGCGGIKTGADVFEHILCGASAVQIGTQLMKEEVTNCSARILAELKELMNQKGYTRLEDFKGKLKSL